MDVQNPLASNEPVLEHIKHDFRVTVAVATTSRYPSFPAAHPTLRTKISSNPEILES